MPEEGHFLSKAGGWGEVFLTQLNSRRYENI